MFRRILSAHVRAAVWAGVVMGAVLGGLAAYVPTSVSFLPQVLNEFLVTWVFHHISQSLSASMGTPFVFFALHLAMGILGGLLAGAALGSVAGMLRVERGGTWANYLGLQLGVWGFVYGLLWILHIKFAPRVETGATAAAVVAAALTGGVGAIVGRLVVKLARRAGRWSAALARGLRVAAGGGAAAVLVVLLVGAARDFGRNPRTAPAGGHSYPVVLIGLDGASWAFIRPLIEEGAMPNLARLVEEGVSGTLRTLLPPIESPTVWTSVATGKRPEKHGIRGFVVKSEETHVVTPVTSDLRRATPFWQIVSDAGLSVDVVCWYVSWPADDVNGVFVSERLLFSDAPRIVSPPEWEVAINAHHEAYLAAEDEELARFTPHPFNPDYSSLNENSRAFLEDQHLSILEYSHRKDTVAFEVARDLLRRGQPDVFAVYFEGTDRVSHRFLIHELARRHRSVMERLYPAVDDEALAEFGNVFRRYHEQVDRWLGELLELVDENTAVMIVSDHGFGIRTPVKIHLRMDPLLEFLGYLHREPEDEDRIDWSRTRLYDANRKTKRLGRVAVNLAERESDGIVPRDRMDDLLAEARAGLEELRTLGGDRVFRSVRILRGAGASDNAGEIAVELDERCVADTVAFAGRRLPVAAFTRLEWMPGNHRIDGIFVGWGGPFKRGARVHSAGVLDVAPTLLEIAGIPPARDMDGRPLERAMDRSRRAELEPGFVDSYEGVSPQRRTVSSTPADSLILRQLRSLGYIK